ncbi:MAG TPA: nucleotidyltransferase family protein [Polyangiaceae bacterium]|nr:nucleotidyltransferase family protein [Polyangiaceae bacterium]
MIPLENQLRHIISSSAWLSAVLETVRDVGPPQAYVAAGAIRDSVWNFLTGRTANVPSGDIDVVYFDANGTWSASSCFETALAERLPGVRWEVTNQTHVHQWYRDSRGQSLRRRAKAPSATTGHLGPDHRR